MSRMDLYIEAPFAVARPFVAGWYRPTAGFLSHSSVYGLLLNIAGVESRLWEHDARHDGKTPASLMREDREMPRFSIALGIPDGDDLPTVQSMYQQLHNYPVQRKNAPIPESWAKGRKNNIQPVRRELLTDVKAVVAIEDDGRFLDQLRDGIQGKSGREYGLPFLGDNSFLIDRLEEVESQPTRWYERLEGESGRLRSSVTRLTVWIDRAVMAHTRSALYAPSLEPSIEPMSGAWTRVGPPAAVE